MSRGKATCDLSARMSAVIRCGGEVVVFYFGVMAEVGGIAC